MSLAFHRSLSTAAVALLLVAPAFAAPPLPFDEEPVRSIYGDDLRCFRFRLEGEVITHEYARAFMARYDDGKNPPIFGASPDREEHVLRVVAPPESEAAVRRTLATWFAELAGTGSLDGLAGFEIDRRSYKREMRSLIIDIGALELARVGLDEDDTRQREQIEQIDDRIIALEQELSIVEKKLAVIARVQERLDAVE